MAVSDFERKEPYTEASVRQKTKFLILLTIKEIKAIKEIKEIKEIK